MRRPQQTSTRQLVAAARLQRPRQPRPPDAPRPRSAIVRPAAPGFHVTPTSGDLFLAISLPLGTWSNRASLPFGANSRKEVGPDSFQGVLLTRAIASELVERRRFSRKGRGFKFVCPSGEGGDYGLLVGHSLTGGKRPDEAPFRFGEADLKQVFLAVGHS